MDELIMFVRLRFSILQSISVTSAIEEVVEPSLCGRKTRELRGK